MHPRAQLDVATDVRDGLTAQPKHLPARLLYDAAGSAIFEEITQLPEYYLTRTELDLFERHGRAMVERAGNDLTVVELGVGSGMKTRVLLRAVLERQKKATFFPVDVSQAALDLTVKTLGPEFPQLEIRPLQGRYRIALEELRSRPGPKLVLFIGSSIGNFDPPEATALLTDIRSALAPQDSLLLGTDLRKDPSILVPAYDDAAGVTARFNLNLLTRINRELRGNFTPERFRHVALWNRAQSRMESYLESVENHVVDIDALELKIAFDQGERIHTENSYKFTQDMVDEILTASGFSRAETWTDARGWFAEHLAFAR